MLKGKSGLLNVDPTAPVLCSSSRQLKWSNGATALITSGCAYEQLRGPEFDCAWIDELAKFPDPQAAFEQLQLAFASKTHLVASSLKMIITTTPKSTPFLKNCSQEGVCNLWKQYDNKTNLSSNFTDCKAGFLKERVLERKNYTAKWLILINLRLSTTTY